MHNPLYPFRTLLLPFALVLVLFSAASADIPVDPEWEREMMTQNLEQKLKGLSPSQQRTKVKEMLAEIPLKKSRIEMEIASPPASGGTPAYMLRKSIDGLSREEAFLKEWLAKHSGQASEQSTLPVKPSSPMTPGGALGAAFLILGLLWGAKRLLATPTTAPAS